MIVQYQESEEMKSNSLDSQLKKKEEELKQQEQEIADQTQLHELTVKELQLGRESLEISQKECSGLKTRVCKHTCNAMVLFVWIEVKGVVTDGCGL